MLRGTVKSDRNIAYITFVSDVNCCTFPKELPQNLESKGNDFVEVAVTDLKFMKFTKLAMLVFFY